MSSPKNLHPLANIEGYDLLKELAMNLIWAWDHKDDHIWKQLDLDLWERTHNAWVVLAAVSYETLKKFLSDPDFHAEVEKLVSQKRSQEASEAWFQKTYPNSPLTCAAYFSMEYMLSEALPIYSGGLGNVAGDQLKAASDLGVPVVGVGLLYQQGYFRQVIDKEGGQKAFYPFNSPEQLPIKPLRKSNGEWIRMEISLPGWSVWLRAWEVRVGRVKLYLLDSNDIVNYPPHRGIASELYGGGVETRLQQELLLGVGGWRLLSMLGLEPEICHLNEGHAAFAALERARCFMTKTGHSFETALETTRAGNLFTTHTAVPAGFDRFPPQMIEHYLGKYAENELKISPQQLLSLGRANPNDSGEPFNMAYFATRVSCAVNGVSKLHGQVSRKIFQNLFPRWPQEEVPISSVTNGIYVPGWDSPMADKVWTEFCGKERWLGTTETLEKELKCASDEKLWEMRNNTRKYMIEYGRERIGRIWRARGMTEEEAEKAKTMLNPEALTLGFARRFATYKRPNLLLRDPARLIRILTNQKKPVQLVIAGKAHPADEPGQAMIREWVQFSQQPEVRPYIIFLTDYDMFMAKNLVSGVDVWINTPRRPWEACGTSGMKVLANGGLNLSELDGWWAEAYCPDVGWALGDGKDRGDDPSWDQQEAEQLYTLLESEVIPEFYSRNEKGIPTSWISRIRESMTRLTPQYSTNRAVRQYTEEFYLPGATRYQKRSADKGALGKEVAEWKRSVQEKWPHLKFTKVEVQTRDNQHQFQVEIDSGRLSTSELLIELYANPESDLGEVKQKMKQESDAM